VFTLHGAIEGRGYAKAFSGELLHSPSRRMHPVPCPLFNGTNRPHQTRELHQENPLACLNAHSTDPGVISSATPHPTSIPPTEGQCRVRPGATPLHAHQPESVAGSEKDAITLDIHCSYKPSSGAIQWSASIEGRAPRSRPFEDVHAQFCPIRRALPEKL